MLFLEGSAWFAWCESDDFSIFPKHLLLQLSVLLFNLFLNHHGAKSLVRHGTE